MMDIEKIKKAVKDINNGAGKCKVLSVLRVRNVAEKVIEANEGLPEKKEIIDDRCFCHTNASGFSECDGCRIKEHNKVIDDCTLAIAKGWVKMPSEEWTESILKEFEDSFTYRDKQGNPRIDNKSPRKLRGFIKSIIKRLGER